jgi:hypothetical protein
MTTTIPTVYIVGANKGGVGKTTVSRCLLDYLKANTIEHRAFDAETPLGVLKRFYADKTEIVDLEESDGQMKVFDTLGSAVTVIDLPARLLSKTLVLLKNIGFLDPAKCKITVLHVLGNTKDSTDEVQSITDSIAGSKYIAIGNHINDTKFDFPEGALDIPMLNARACENVDAANTSFVSYANSDASAVLRGYVRHWLALVFVQFDSAKLNVL